MTDAPETRFINKIYQLIAVITITYSDYKPQMSNNIKYFFWLVQFERCM